VQKQELHDQAKQETETGQDGNQEVLPFLQDAYIAQGSKGITERGTGK
jgi:hypothetical protein